MKSSSLWFFFVLLCIVSYIVGRYERETTWFFKDEWGWCVLAGILSIYAYSVKIGKPDVKFPLYAQIIGYIILIGFIIIYFGCVLQIILHYWINLIVLGVLSVLLYMVYKDWKGEGQDLW